MKTLTRVCIDNYDDILENLYERYYRSFSGHSEVTSSYWARIGRQKVIKQDGQWSVDGFGFGSFRPADFIGQLKFLPQHFLLSHLIKKNNCPRGMIDLGKHVARGSGRIFDFDCLKQVFSLQGILNLLSPNGNLVDQGIKTVCIIGDGYGFFTSLVKLFNPAIKVITVNLGRTLFFDVLFSQKCIPGVSPLLLTQQNKSPLTDHQLVFVEAEHYGLLEGLPINLFINIASMQEMNPGVIERYFQYMRSSSAAPCYLYCCNRLQKLLPDGTITEFMQYPWQDSRVFLDERCPWYQKYPSSKPPFWLPFDGPFQHRLVQLK